MIAVNHPRTADRRVPAHLDQPSADADATDGPQSTVFRRPASAMPRHGPNARHGLREHHVDKQALHRRAEKL
jgi:hypothetical protein